jgi:hypothetical protein
MKRLAGEKEKGNHNHPANRTMNTNMSMKTLEALKVVFQATLAKMGVEETDERMLALAENALEVYPILKAEAEEQNRCHAPIKSGDKKGQTCGKTLKDGQCAVHKDAIHPPAACSMILTSGDKKGQACGKTCAAGKTRCGLHASLPEPGTGCEYIYNRGADKGKRCDKKQKDGCAFCSEHQSKPKDSKEKEPKAPKAKAEPKPKEEPKEKEQIRCVRRAGVAVIKGTCIAIEPESTDIIGYVSSTGAEDNLTWTFHGEWHDSMPEVRDKYEIVCPFSKRMMIVDEE